VQAVLPGQVVDVAVGVVDDAAVVGRGAQAAEAVIEILVGKAVVLLVGEAYADLGIT